MTNYRNFHKNNLRKYRLDSAHEIKYLWNGVPCKSTDPRVEYIFEIHDYHYLAVTIIGQKFRILLKFTTYTISSSHKNDHNGIVVVPSEPVIVGNVHFQCGHYKDIVKDSGCAVLIQTSTISQFKKYMINTYKPTFSKWKQRSQLYGVVFCNIAGHLQTKIKKENPNQSI